MTRILILGGTAEAAELANDLVAEGHQVTTSLAGRTKEPKSVAGILRIGGFGGAAGLANWMRENEIEHLIDATHPFALQISRNASEAACETGIRFERFDRPAWQKQTGDHWIVVPNLQAASNVIPAGARVLLALGSQHLEEFSNRDDVHFTIRMITPPANPLPFRNHDLVLAKPSTDWNDEAALLERKNISHIISRNSGGAGAYAKIKAARELSLPVIMIERETL